MKRLLAFLLSLAAFLAAPASAEELRFDGGEAHLSRMLGSSVTVEVLVLKVETGSGSPYRGALMWGGDEERLPTQVVSALQVSIDKKRVTIPLAAYADLAAPSQAEIREVRGGFTIVLSGGDAGGAYQAEFDFKRGQLVRRIVFSREFPDQVRETTQFLFFAN